MFFMYGNNDSSNSNYKNDNNGEFNSLDIDYVDGLKQDWGNSIANVLELPKSCGQYYWHSCEVKQHQWNVSIHQLQILKI